MLSLYFRFLIFFFSVPPVFDVNAHTFSVTESHSFHPAILKVNIRIIVHYTVPQFKNDPLNFCNFKSNCNRSQIDHQLVKKNGI